MRRALKEMLTAQTISNKWLAIILTEMEKHETREKALEKSAPTETCLYVDTPAACVYVALFTGAKVSVECILRCDTSNAQFGIRCKQNLWMELEI